MRRVLMKTALLSALTAAFLTLTAAASVLGTAVVTADSLRLRSEANTDCATVTYLLEGTSVQVYEELEGWYKDVSYTHLDVYKRQPLCAAGTWNLGGGHHGLLRLGQA